MWWVIPMAKKKTTKPHLPRRKWTRSPVQKPHSSKHGRKGYDRKRDSDDLGDDVVDEEK